MHFIRGPAGISAYSLDSSASDIYSDADMVRSFVPRSFNGISIFNTGHADLFGDLFNRWIDGCVRMNGKSGVVVYAACSVVEFADGSSCRSCFFHDSQRWHYIV